MSVLSISTPVLLLGTNAVASMYLVYHVVVVEFIFTTYVFRWYRIKFCSKHLQLRGTTLKSTLLSIHFTLFHHNTMKDI